LQAFLVRTPGGAHIRRVNGPSSKEGGMSKIIAQQIAESRQVR